MRWLTPSASMSSLLISEAILAKAAAAATMINELEAVSATILEAEMSPLEAPETFPPLPRLIFGIARVLPRWAKTWLNSF